MGLATPAAIMAGTKVAARRGILIRDGTALEKSGTITAVVLDKTGTLTQGKLLVAALEDLREASQCPIPLEEIAATLAQPSNHPVSQAVAAVCDRRKSAPSEDTHGGRGPPLQDWQELPGKGVQASFDGAIYRLGSLNWLRECGVVGLALPSPPRRGEDTAPFRATDSSTGPSFAFAAHWSAQGATILALADERRLVGLFAPRATLK